MARGSRIVYAAAAWLFVVGVVVQVFLAGMVVVARLSGWDNHIGLGHGLGMPLVVMLISMYLGRLPGSAKRLTWLLFALYFIQADIVIFMRNSVPIVSAVHPVIAVFDFAIGWALARRALAFVQEQQTAAPPQAAADPAGD